MPNIDINAGPNVSSLISSRRATAADMGGNKELEQAGADITAFAKEIKTQNDRSTAVEIERGLIDLETDMAQFNLETEENAEAGGAGHVDRVKGAITASSEKFTERFSGASKENQQRLTLGLARFNNRHTTGAARFQARKKGEKVVADVNSGLDAVLNGVRDGSWTVEDGEAFGTAILDAADLPGNAKAKTLEVFSNQLAVKDMTRRIDDVDYPDEAIGLRDEATKLKGKLGADAYSRILSAIDTKEDQLYVQQENETISDQAEHMAALNSGNAGNGFTSDRLDNIRDPKKRAIQAQKLFRAEQVFTFATRLRGMEPAQIDAEYARLQEDLKIEGNVVVEPRMLAVLRRERALRSEGQGALTTSIADRLTASELGGEVDQELLSEDIAAVVSPDDRRVLEEARNKAIEVGEYANEAAQMLPGDLQSERLRLIEERKIVGATGTADAQIAAIDRELSSRQEDSQAFKNELNDRILTIADGAIPEGETKEALYNDIDARLLTDLARTEAKKLVDMAFTQSVESAKVPYMTVTERTARMKELGDQVLKSDGANINLARAQFEGFKEANRIHQGRIENDPSVYAAENNSIVREAGEVLETARDGGDPTEIRDARKAYVLAQQAEQARYGRHPNDVQLLSPAQVAGIANDMRMADPEDPEGQGLHSKLAKLQETWGESFGLVSKQLQKKGVFTGTTRVAASVADPNIAKKLLEVQAVVTRDKSYFDGLSVTNSSTDIEKVVLDQMSEHTSSLIAQPGGRSAVSEYNKAVTLLTKEYMLNNQLDVNEAAEKAANDIITNQYTYNRSYRVPNRPDIDPAAVMYGAGATLQQIPLDNIIIDETALGVTDVNRAETRRQNIISIRDSGYWVTSPDEDGLVLYNGAGVPVFTPGADGTMSTIKKSWSELSQTKPIANTFRRTGGVDPRFTPAARSQ